MKVFIMRHGEAVHLAASDAERELTPRGVEQSLKVADQCVQQAYTKFDKVFVSPYIRAQQTWKAIGSKFSVGSTVTYDEITPYGDSEDAFQYISAVIQSEKLESVLLVSHLPLVGYLTAEFVPGLTPPMFPTSGLACIEFNPEKQTGELLWHINART